MTTPTITRFTVWRRRRWIRRHPENRVAHLLLGDVIAGCLGDWLRRVLQ